MNTLENTQETPVETVAPPVTGTFIFSKYDVEPAKREALDALSLKTFRSKSRWLKLCTKGGPVLRTEEVTELVPRDDDSGESDERKAQVPVKYMPNGRPSGDVKVYDTRRFSVEEVEARMLEIKARQDALKALIDKMQAEQKAQRDAQAAALAATKSAV